MRLLRCTAYMLLFIYACDGMAQQGKPVADSLKQKTDNSAQQKKSLLNISEVVLWGNKKTKSFIILRELPFIRGEWLTQNELDRKLVLAKHS